MAVDLVTGIRMLDAVVDVPSSVFKYNRFSSGIPMNLHQLCMFVCGVPWKELEGTSTTASSMRIPVTRSTAISVVLHCVSINYACYKVNVHTNVLQNVEPYYDAVLSLAPEIVPEDDACVETRWTVICFKFES